MGLPQARKYESGFIVGTKKIVMTSQTLDIHTERILILATHIVRIEKKV